MVSVFLVPEAAEAAVKQLPAAAVLVGAGGAAAFLTSLLGSFLPVFDQDQPPVAAGKKSQVPPPPPIPKLPDSNLVGMRPPRRKPFSQHKIVTPPGQVTLGNGVVGRRKPHPPPSKNLRTSNLPIKPGKQTNS